MLNCACVCVCVCVSLERETEGERQRESERNISANSAPGHKENITPEKTQKSVIIILLDMKFFHLYLGEIDPTFLSVRVRAGCGTALSVSSRL